MRYVIQLAALIVSFVVGVFVYALLADWLPLQAITSHLYEGWQWGLSRIGVTLWGLAGLTLYFIVLTVRLVTHRLRHTTPIASDGLRLSATPVQSLVYLAPCWRCLRPWCRWTWAAAFRAPCGA